MIARRDLLKRSVGVSLAGSLGAWPGVAVALSGANPDRAFAFAADRVPMNAANLCPMPTAVAVAVARYSGELERDMSAANRRRIEAMKEDARSGIAGQLGTASDEIAIVRNTSEANSIVVQGLNLTADDEVLLWDQNHPSNALAWQVLAAREGFRVRYFAVPATARSIDEVVDAVSGAVGARTRLVSFTHISNVTGFRLPAAEICAELRRRRAEVFIHIDGAQTWGVRDVNLGDLDCDSFTGSAHKWYMGPRETGMLYVREPRQDEVAASVVSIPSGAAVAERLRGALKDLGVPFVSSNHTDFRSNVIILVASEATRREVAERVFQESGVIPAATGGLRFSPHIYNTAEHVDRVVAAVSQVRPMLG